MGIIATSVFHCGNHLIFRSILRLQKRLKVADVYAKEIAEILAYTKTPGSALEKLNLQ